MSSSLPPEPTANPDLPRSVEGYRSHRLRNILLSTLAAISLVLLVGFVYAVHSYRQLARVVEQQLERGPYARTINFYGAPETFSVGDTVEPSAVASALHRAGYREAPSAAHGWFELSPSSLTVHPATSGTPLTVISFGKTSAGKAGILDISDGHTLDHFTLPSPLVSNLSADGRERRVIVRFSDLPPVLIDAITSAEDKHFFSHRGYDPLRIAKAMYVDARSGRKEQGASTISMQLARNLYLTPDKQWKRKVTEFLITLHLERALTKQQIFEYYCNQVYLGGYGSFSINGFGEAARSYFNKDVHRLDLPEAATLAGLVQRPSYFNPFRSPDRARDRRNIVLRLMHANRYITEEQLSAALASPLALSPGRSEVSQTQVSMNLANAEFQKLFEGHETSGITNVYTSIDMRLQQAAEKAVLNGLAEVDRLLAKRRSASGGPARAEAALIAIDPHSGAIKAVVGGRDFSVSQLDRVLAHRPPGSVFKPFVYAAALNGGLNGGDHVITPATMVDDSPTTFSYDGQSYQPDNFQHEFHGPVTLRQALAKSMNVAAVKVGEMVGFDSVVSLARLAGMNEDIRATPAVALGAYEVTPFEIARAYTAFANGGLLVQPTSVDTIRDQNGEELYRTSLSTQRVLDPRVNFQLVDMLQDVLRYGTAAGVRSRGFTLPAAGKTGTSHDGWFAGFTSQLLCVVWVGFDDYRQLGLEGAHSALPIWTSFMSEAAQTLPYRDTKAFLPPDGLVHAGIDPTTGLRPTPFCPRSVSDYFLAGTEPSQLCMIHQDDAVPVLPTPLNSAPSTVGTILKAASAPVSPVK